MTIETASGKESIPKIWAHLLKQFKEYYIFITPSYFTITLPCTGEDSNFNGSKRIQRKRNNKNWGISFLRTNGPPTTTTRYYLKNLVWKVEQPNILNIIPINELINEKHFQSRAFNVMTFAMPFLHGTVAPKSWSVPLMENKTLNLSVKL